MFLGTFALSLALLALPLGAAAQQPPRVPRIGVISSLDRSGGTPDVQAFKQGLRDLGYVEGKNIVFEYRWQPLERLANLGADTVPSDIYAAELVRLNVDVIVVGTGRAALSAKKATETIPIVVALAPDPVGEGLAASLARPGGNITGLSFLSTELASKQLELLKAAVPTVSRVAILWTGVIPSHPLLLRELEVAARTLRLTLQPLEVRGPDELDGAFAAMTRQRAGGLLVLPNMNWVRHQARLHDLAAKHRLPAMYSIVGHADAGGLMAYGADARHNWGRAATYVDKILKGAKPGDLPIEQPTKFELVLNLKTAKVLGLTIPQGLLLQADRVIQ
ncbi:MAG: ABC transporter substrate-binding protein [Candidatus Rokubacteria bacterium]|nr:ABC transporter substrate-binding protein [Candidatus Rokubacteria bacterium]